MAPKKGQANYARASPVPTKELFEELDEVNFLKDKDICWFHRVISRSYGS